MATVIFISILLIKSAVSSQYDSQFRGSLQSGSGLPNFVVFVIDDLLYTKKMAELIGAPDPEIYGGNLTRHEVHYLDIEMPKVEAFMDESVIIPRSYSNPKCAPSRYSLLTGRQIIKCDLGRRHAEFSGNSDIGMTVEVPTSTLSGPVDGVYNLQSTLNASGYYTGMVGKWHLMSPDDNGHAFGCMQLDDTSIPLNVSLYKKCREIVKDQGFDFVNAWIYGNVPDNHPNFSHSPEWMVSQSQKFIDTAIANDQPFFLYFASTLTHHPSAMTALTNYTRLDSPMGKLTGDDIPDDTAMKGRSQIVRDAKSHITNTSGIGFRKLETIASYYWFDEQFGALMTYLQDKDIYDDTFIVLINDHGMGCKDSLYEQGIRIINSIRYPPKFGTDGYVLPTNFIVHTSDIAAVIYNLAEIDLDADFPDYELDGTDWMEDVEDYINNGDDSDPDCCEYRIIDIFNSHAIVDENYKYIFRATSQHVNRAARYYPFVNDSEQLYDLESDGAEQINLAYSDDPSIQQILYQYQEIMTDYIIDEVCLCDDENDCIVPNMVTINSNTGVDSDSDDSDDSDDSSTESPQQAADADVSPVTDDDRKRERIKIGDEDKEKDDISDFYGYSLQQEKNEELILEELSKNEADTVNMADIVLVFTYFMVGIVCLGVGVFIGTKWKVSVMEQQQAILKNRQMDM